jgi:hypothetical protein
MKERGHWLDQMYCEAVYRIILSFLSFVGTGFADEKTVDTMKMGLIPR